MREVNARVLGKWLELLRANCGRAKISQLLFEDDRALVADSEEKLCKLVSEFGTVCEKSILRVAYKCMSNACETKWYIVIEGGLFYVFVLTIKWQRMVDRKSM